MPRVLAFDIGIKNLAYSIIERDTNEVIALENINIMAPVEPILCSRIGSICKHLAKYAVNGNREGYCKRHLPVTHTILKELDECKKTPTRQQWKDWAETYQCIATGTTIDSYRQALSTRFAFPVIQPKQTAVATLSLEQIHDALRAFVESRWEIFQTVQHILLENQPAFKNPHMKSVQVLLFATLREKALSSLSVIPSFHLVHAKKKVSDAKKGDAGYAERKQKSEERVRLLYESKSLQGSSHFEKWKAAKKKSDMADAICMAVDFILKK